MAAERTTVTRSTALGPEQRDAALRAMRHKELDILVIGGGIVGTGSALDAVTRGLRTGLVEARDWASGTSSRSSKLVHGGIRYLEQLDFRLVREALIERGLLLQRIAPHLVKPVRFLYPLTMPLFERFYIGAGMTLYDLFSYTGLRPPGVPHHRHLTKRQLLRAAPSLHPDAFTGGLTYWDAQVDDAKYVATLARTASFYGAHVASRVRVEGFVKVGERVVGVKAHDLETDEHFEILAKQVVNATGVWTDETQAMVGARGQFKVRASKGVHLVVPRDRFHSKVGLLLRTEKSVLFVIPWGRHWLIGTTDTDWHLDKAHPAATAADIDYLLERVNEVLAVPLTRDDVEGVYAGLRPLLAGESEETSKLSREHIVAHTVPGLVVVAGGKWTTYRVMAKDAIDEAVAALDG
ncbi:MAG: glycerol-3-phosphate dehydrogenase/oxidase, partial [Pseudolysinimonas sp.]